MTTLLNPNTYAIAQNSTGNTYLSDIIGNRTDTSFSNGTQTPSIIGHLTAAYNHIHSSSIIYPRDDDSVSITAASGSWNEGTKTEIVPASTITYLFDIHWIIVGTISAVDDYVVKLYTGDSGSEVFWGEAAFSRDSNQVRGSQFPVQGHPIPANTRISASLLSGSGNNTVDIKVYTHEYQPVN